MIKRPCGDADQRYDRRDPAPPGLPGYVPIVENERDAREPQQQAGPLQRRHPLTQKAAGECRCQDRLQAWNERGQAGGYRLADGERDTSEIEAVNQQSRDNAVQKLRAFRPRRPACKRNDKQNADGHDHTERQPCERLRACERQFCCDKSRAPQHDKKCRRRTHN